MDPDALILVWRRKLSGDEALQVTDTGRTWRLPRADEVGLARSPAAPAGRIAWVAEAPHDFDPGRMHRWVRVDALGAEVAEAFASTGAAVVVWRRFDDGAVRVLVLHRSVAGPDYEGDWAWTPPGGGVDPGETIEACAQRELLEEAGLDLALVRVPAPGFAIFVAEASAEHEIVLSDEHDRFEWLPVEDACARCLPAVVPESIRRALAHAGVA